MNALERLGAYKLMEANQAATELLLKGATVDGDPDPQGHPAVPAVSGGPEGNRSAANESERLQLAAKVPESYARQAQARPLTLQDSTFPALNESAAPITFIARPTGAPDDRVSGQTCAAPNLVSA